MGFIIVTGGTSGVGLAIAKDLIKKGYQVLGVGRNKKKGQFVQEQLGPLFHFIQADISSEQGVEIVEKASRAFPDKLDVLIHSAGVFPKTGEENRRVNIRPHYFLTMALRQQLRGGRVLLVTGNPLAVKNAPIITGQLTTMQRAMWLLSRKTLLVKKMAAELTMDEITVNAFFPGDVHSELMSYTLSLLRTDVPVGAYLALSKNIKKVSGEFFDEVGNLVPLSEKKYNVESANRILKNIL